MHDEQIKLTPSLPPQPIHFRAEGCTAAPANSELSAPAVCFDGLACARKKTETVKGFKFCTFIGRFHITLWQ